MKQLNRQEYAGSVYFHSYMWNDLTIFTFAFAYPKHCVNMEGPSVLPTEYRLCGVCEILVMTSDYLLKQS